MVEKHIQLEKNVLLLSLIHAGTIILEIILQTKQLRL